MSRKGAEGLRKARQGVRFERSIVREAWEKGFFAIRGAGSGSGTSAYPKPDLLIFRPGGVVDVVQVKTTRRREVAFPPSTWSDEIQAAQRLRALGFQARTWLLLKLVRPGRSVEKLIRVDGHEEDTLRAFYDERMGVLRYGWRKRARSRGA